MEKLILNIVEYANLNTSADVIYEVCDIQLNPESRAFKRTRQRTYEDFEIDDVEHGLKAKTLKEMKDITVLVREFIVLIKKAISENIAAPPEVQLYERTCLCLRTTLIRDHWYENNQKTRMRSEMIHRIHHLFTLQMFLRLWKRYDHITKKPTGEPTGLWCDYKAFYNSYFYVDNFDKTDEESMKIIRDWSPERVARALRTLRLLRSDGQVDLRLPQIRDLFYEYSNALYDRVAMFCTMQINENLDNLNLMERKWFRVVGQPVSDLNIMVGDNSHRVYTKEIRKYLAKEEKEYLEKRKEEEDYDEKDENIVAESSAAKHKRIDPIRRRARLNGKIQELDNLKYIRREIAHFRGFEDVGEGQWDFITPPTIVADNEMDESDRREVIRLSTKIHKLEKEIQRQTIEVEKLEKKAALEKAKQTANIIVSEYKSSQICEAEPLLSQDFFLLVDSICIWQERHSQSVDADTSSVAFTILHEEVVKTIEQTVTKNNDAHFINECSKWILYTTVTSYEREEYRYNYSGGGIFNLGIVIQAQRSEEHGQLPDFPTDLDILLEDPTNQYYEAANDYFAYWWVGQYLSGVSAATSVFFFDIEEELISIDHENLRSPVLSRLGKTWVLVPAGKWYEKGCLNCIRIGSSLSEALTVWMFEIAKRAWIVHDRKLRRMVSIRNTRLKDVWDSAKDINCKRLSEL